MDCVFFHSKQLWLGILPFSEDVSDAALQQVATFALMEKGQFFWLTSKCPPSSKFKEFSAVSR
jgi:hypothetical protein